MPIRFTKMHGLGNDYVYVSLFDQQVKDPAALARAVSDRHRGVGSDGLILLAPADGDADLRMIMFNADGSRAQMCGNGIRCVAKLAFERGLARRNPLRVATDAGVLALDLAIEQGRVERVRVDMGAPILAAGRIPVAAAGDPVIGLAVPLGDRTLSATCVSMGNPHAVFFVPKLADVPLREWGPQIEHHTLFPDRVNAHFVEVHDRTHVSAATWERGSGATQACGTGAAAVGVACMLNGLTERRVVTTLPGGDLEIEWDAAGGHVFMTGPATEVFDGVWPE